MKYITLIIGLLVMGCGKQEQTDTERLEEENRKLKAQLESKKLKAELEVENKKLKADLLRLSVLGEYEGKVDGETDKMVFLDNGINEYYTNGVKCAEYEWKIVDGEIHVSTGIYQGAILKINKDGSITWEESNFKKKSNNPIPTQSLFIYQQTQTQYTNNISH